MGLISLFCFKFRICSHVEFQGKMELGHPDCFPPIQVPEVSSVIPIDLVYNLQKQHCIFEDDYLQRNKNSLQFCTRSVLINLIFFVKSRELD